MSMIPFIKSLFFNLQTVIKAAMASSMPDQMLHYPHLILRTFPIHQKLSAFAAFGEMLSQTWVEENSLAVIFIAC